MCSWHLHSLRLCHIHELPSTLHSLCIWCGSWFEGCCDWIVALCLNFWHPCWFWNNYLHLSTTKLDPCLNDNLYRNTTKMKLLITPGGNIAPSFCAVIDSEYIILIQCHHFCSILASGLMPSFLLFCQHTYFSYAIWMNVFLLVAVFEDNFNHGVNFSKISCLFGVCGFLLSV